MRPKNLICLTAFALAGCAQETDLAPPPPGKPVVGQIVVDSDNPRWFRFHEGGPFFMCGPGDPEGFLYRGDLNPDGTRDGDQLELIRKLAPTGANSIYLMAVRSHGGDGDATQNPFVDHKPRKGLNEKVLDQWETWFSEMDRNGIVIFLFLYDDSARIWNTGKRVKAAESDFIHQLVDRFEHHKHLIWVVGEEYSERYHPIRVSRIAREIRAADDHDHPIAVHKLHGLDFAEFAEDPYVDQFAIQFNVPTAAELHEAVLEARGRAGGDFNLNLAEASNWGTAEEARQKIWSVAMAGAYVMAYEMDIASTSKRDLEDCGRLVRFMQNTEFSSMEPRDELATGDTLYVMAKEGNSYIAYSPTARDSMGVKKLTPGSYELRWMDVADGLEVTQVVDLQEFGEVTWAIPGGLGTEVVLHLQRLGPPSHGS